jgi:hypothetical protein
VAVKSGVSLVRRRRSPRRMSKVPAEPEEGLTSSRRVAFIGRTKCARGLGRAISAVKGHGYGGSLGAQRLPVRDMARRPNKAVSSILIRWSRRAPRLNPTAGRGRMYIEIQLGQRARLFHFACEIGLATAFVALEPGRCRCGSRPGAPRVRGPGGYGMLPALSETRTKADLP